MKKTVMIFGTFDILHPGHLFFLQQAKKRGDRLVVCIARDETVKKIKQQPPVHTEQERKKMISAFAVVDQVILGDKKDPYNVIKKIQPDVIALGYDQQVFVDGLRMALQKNNLRTKIVRISAHFPQKYASRVIKQTGQYGT